MTLTYTAGAALQGEGENLGDPRNLECLGILCMAPFCGEGSNLVPFLREGECCAECIPLEEACASLKCEPGQECRFNGGSLQPTCFPVDILN